MLDAMNKDLCLHIIRGRSSTHLVVVKVTKVQGDEDDHQQCDDAEHHQHSQHHPTEQLALKEILHPHDRIFEVKPAGSFGGSCCGGGIFCCLFVLSLVVAWRGLSS